MLTPRAARLAQSRAVPNALRQLLPPRQARRTVYQQSPPHRAPPPPPPPPHVETPRPAQSQQTSRGRLPKVARIAVLASAFLLSGLAAYRIYDYYVLFYNNPILRLVPLEVANALRKAIFYSDYYPNPKLARKYYTLALELCAQHDLDPLSDAVMGISIHISGWLERGRQDIKAAAIVLESVLDMNKQWLQLCERDPLKLPRAPVPGLVVADGETQWTIAREEFDRWLSSNRNRILHKTVAVSLKLSEYYASDAISDIEKSHEHSRWAVQTSLDEFRRRATEGVKDGEGGWMTHEEMGAQFESLAHSYERKQEFDLALPLFFHALRYCKDQCHMAVIMNNLAISFAQHPPRAPYQTLEGIAVGGTTLESENPTQQPWTRKELLDSAQRWAKNALFHAKEPKDNERTSECDQARAVALINLGDIAALAGDRTEAARRYKQGKDVSSKKNFEDGIKQAEAGLAKLALP